MSQTVIIGGGSGIGAALKDKLLSNKQPVTATYSSSAIIPEANLTVHPFDATNPEASFDFLPNGITGLVYCPGTINLKPFKRFKDQDFRDDFELQVLGAIRTIRAAIPKFDPDTVGSIVLFSTVAVHSGFPFHSQVATSKGAVEGLTKSLAAEFTPKIRVNCIAPSLTDTPLAGRLLNSEDKKQLHGDKHPLKRVGEAEDIANAAHFLLSQESSWMTGQVLRPDGGKSSVIL